MTENQKKKELKLMRRNKKGTLTRALKVLRNQQKEELAIQDLSDRVQRAEKLLEAIEESHNELVSLIEDEAEFLEEEKWMERCQTEFMVEIEAIKINMADHGNQSKQTSTSADSSSSSGVAEMKPTLKLKRMELPVFDGDVKKYSRFKEDFTKFVQPSTHPDQLAFALRQALSRDPLRIIGPVEDEYEKMWLRLDERYGCERKLVEAIINEVENKKEVREGDGKKLVEFIDVVESSYRALVKIKKESEMSNMKVLSEIERKLPDTVFQRWVRDRIKTEDKKAEKEDVIVQLIEFLKTERKRVEYTMESMRGNHSSRQQTPKSSAVLAADVQRVPQQLCLIHEDARHNTEECKSYIALKIEDRVRMLKDKRACFCCLKTGHIVARCWKKRPCGKNGCTRVHHPSIHFLVVDQKTQQSGTMSTIQNNMHNNEVGCLLQVMSIKCRKGPYLSAMFDSGAMSSLVTHEAARAMKVKGKPVTIKITKVGGEASTIETTRYQVPLIDGNGEEVMIAAYGIERITAKVKPQETKKLAKILEISHDKVRRPVGDVNILIGYDYAGFHPREIKKEGHLLLLECRFGMCIGGAHPNCRSENCATEISLLEVKHREFFDIESLGIDCNPRCGSCKCGKCPLGAKQYSVKEERELNIIEEGLTYEEGRWVAKYPWIKDPKLLPDNRAVVIAKLKSLEVRLSKNQEAAKVYNEQIEDMIERKVAREVGEEELREYNGPIHYIAHHAVLKADSESTPVRIVFNSSASYRGHMLNDYWAKGPDLNNNLLAVLLRFRCEQVALVGDIRKMFHSISISLLDQHCHRFLWRGLEIEKPLKTYCVTAVNFGDKPSATIAIAALRKTAEMGREKAPEAADTILNNVYMDDVLQCVETREMAERLVREVDCLLKPGNFAIKKWVISGEESGEEQDRSLEVKKVLGICWKPKEDLLTFQGNFSMFRDVPQPLTKRICLSKINGVYDPLGLLTPVTVRAKILLRKLWGEGLAWDEPIKEEYQQEWFKLFSDLEDSSGIMFRRCVKPVAAKPGVGPTLVMFSDASEKAMGAVAYVRYEVQDGSYESRLMASKSRVAPIEITSIVRLELSAAVLSKRLAKTIMEETNICFQRVFYIVDSMIVRAMIQKQSYGFKTFAATRIGEIQRDTDPQDWFWIAGEDNVADIISRGTDPSEIKEMKAWQCGPEFLKWTIEEWPTSQSCGSQEIPERVKVVLTADVEPVGTLTSLLNPKKFGDCHKLMRVTARVIKACCRRSLKALVDDLSADDLKKAECLWVKELQRPMLTQLREHKSEFDKKYATLGPRLREDEVIVVGDRIKNHVHFSYNHEAVPLLPCDHPVTRLIVENVHAKGHTGIAATVAKVRAHYWVIRLRQLVKRVKHDCIPCRRFEKQAAGQQMAPLPIQRLKPSPPWAYVGIDLFGPFVVRGEVQKRTRGKAYGVIINCLATRAIHLDIATDYSTEAFLQVFRRFVSVRGYPKEIYTDCGTQLSAADKALKSFGGEQGVKWKFTTPNAPWQNGVTENLLRGVKKSLFHTVGEQVLSMSELQTVMFEISNLLNDRPLGRHPESPDEGKYLCPNDLLLGRSSTKVPDGPWCGKVGPKQRIQFIQSLVNNFWKKWTSNYFTTLIIRKKWHVERRNLQVKDVVLVQDSNVYRGKWKMGIVTLTYPDEQGQVRNVEVRTVTETGVVVMIKRAAQRLVVLIPVEEQ